MDEKKMKMMALTSAILNMPPKIMEKEAMKFVAPEVIEPEIVISPSGQEKRRERRRQARKKK